VNAALLFGGGDTLHSMHAAFVFKFGVDFLTLNSGDYFFHTAD
jgi:hypothetical protein